jgi:hypothetical protein
LSFVVVIRVVNETEWQTMQWPWLTFAMRSSKTWNQLCFDCFGKWNQFLASGGSAVLIGSLAVLPAGFRGGVTVLVCVLSTASSTDEQHWPVHM